jgi:hypothetical protein
MPPNMGYLEKIYEKDAETGAYVISVALDGYGDVFNEWDPAPFKKRDLDADLRKYLENCSSDIPFDCHTIVCFNVPEGERDEKKEESVVSGLKNYFSFYLSSRGYELKVARKRGLLFAAISAALLFTAVSLSSYASIDSLYLVFIEGIYICGWVFLWEAISTSVFKSKKAKTEYHYYKRFSESPIRFKYVAAHAQ